VAGQLPRQGRLRDQFLQPQAAAQDQARPDADERIVLPSVRREVFHPHSDRPRGIWANCYAYEEAFGEKLRALGERTRAPADLYDVVNLYRHRTAGPRLGCSGLLRRKCEYKAIPVLRSSRHSNRKRLRQCGDMLSHQLPCSSAQ